MVLHENPKLEYKRDLSKRYLKTVSAFANYDGGKIIFGVDNDGHVIGLEDVDKTRMAIEKQINDNLDPVPEFSLSVDTVERTITLAVSAGANTPYVYQNKAYKRSDTATVAIDRVEYNRLVLRGQNRDFEELPSENQQLTFSYLEARLIQQIRIEKWTQDTEKTLALYSDKNGFNQAAALVSDSHSFPGIDIAMFGESVDIFLDRQQFSGISIIKMFDDVTSFIAKHYSLEQIIAYERIKVEQVPIKAIREAVANALVHREWDLRTSIRIAMYPNRVVITSPGGLPFGVSREEYIHGQVSMLRNPRIAHVFALLGIIEKFGTGIRRIMDAYRESVVKPTFDVFSHSISVTLPVQSTNEVLDEEEQEVLYIIQHFDDQVSRLQIEEQTGFNKAKVIRILNALQEKSVIQKVGSGPATMYRSID